MGIDVEHDRPLDDLEELVRASLTAEEAARVSGVAECRRRREFLRCWTAKEAALKAHGLGLEIPPRNAAIRFGRDDRPVAVDIVDASATARYRAMVLDPFGPSDAIVAVAGNGFSELRLALVGADARIFMME
ncbi:MAG TPA: 4'-phosphopantetheinyl transferase superfamily protein [Candidatus Cybelea sp.]|nr:4'-phosphopantetheinyl transferase superfamily protein [Candidatus Cybelea sp.]